MPLLLATFLRLGDLESDREAATFSWRRVCGGNDRLGGGVVDSVEGMLETTPAAKNALLMLASYSDPKKTTWSQGS